MSVFRQRVLWTRRLLVLSAIPCSDSLSDEDEVSGRVFSHGNCHALIRFAVRPKTRSYFSGGQFPFFGKGASLTVVLRCHPERVRLCGRVEGSAFVVARSSVGGQTFSSDIDR